MNSGGGGGRQPQFDAYGTARAQEGANVRTGISNSVLSNTNQITPYGRLTYRESGGRQVGDEWVPSWTAEQTLDPQQQAMLNKSNNLQNTALDYAGPLLNRLGSTIGSGLNFDGAPALRQSSVLGSLGQRASNLAGTLDYEGPTDPTALRDKGYDALMSRARTDLGRAAGAEDVQLANQGIAQGSEAWNRAKEHQDRALVDASNAATIGAGNLAQQDASILGTLAGARSQLAGTQGNLLGTAANLEGANFNQDLTRRNQWINETEALRNSPLQDYQAIMGFGGGAQNPNFVSTPQGQVPGTDVTTPAMQQFQGQMNAWNQQNANSQATQGGLFGLGGSVLGGLVRGWASAGFPLPSDARIKENVDRIGTTPNGLGIYAYNHIGDPTRRIGLMAQEVEIVRPDAVVEIGGIKHVYYERALADA